jgi:hypothetical protein
MIARENSAYSDQGNGGYVQAMPGTTSGHLHQFEKSLKEWAALNGYDLHERVFVDRNYASCREFDAMVAEIATRCELRGPSGRGSHPAFVRPCAVER